MFGLSENRACFQDKVKCNVQRWPLVSVYAWRCRHNAASSPYGWEAVAYVQASRPKAPAVVFTRLTNSQPPERPALAAFGLGIGSWLMICRKLCFSLIAIASFCLLSSVSLAAVGDVRNEGTNTTTQEQKPTLSSLICETIHPVNPPKGEDPRSCDSYCSEKGAVCTGVQSNVGPPPSCEDGIFKGSGNCRCCTVQP